MHKTFENIKIRNNEDYERHGIAPDVAFKDFDNKECESIIKVHQEI